MTYKKRPKRMCSDEFIAKAMELIGAHGGLCQLHCENGDVLCFLEDKYIAAAAWSRAILGRRARRRRGTINRAVRIGGLTGCPSTRCI